MRSSLVTIQSISRKPVVRFSTFVFLIQLLLFIPASGQDTPVRITDQQGIPVYPAHVKFTGLGGTTPGKYKWVTTNPDGIAFNPFIDTTLIEVSYIGYIPLKDTLLPLENKTLMLFEEVSDLEELVVTAHFAPIKLKESTFRIQTIDENKITEKGANDLREALNNELMFKTNNGHVNETALNLNGLSGNHVKFMIDGVPVEGRIKGNIDLSQVNLNEVERVEIIDGPTSVAYGTNALGGVINIITKKTQPQKLVIQVKNYYESIGKYNISGKVGFKMGRNLFKLSGGRNFFSGFGQSDTSRYKDWKPREQYFGSLLFTRRIHHLTFSYLMDGFYELMTSRGAPRSPYFINAFDTHYKTNRFTNKVLVNGRINKGNFVDITASQAWYKRSRNIYFKDLITLSETLTDGSTDQDTTMFNNVMFRGVFSTHPDSHTVAYMLGTELKQDYILSNRVNDRQQQIGDYALFGDLKIRLFEKMKIQPSVRYARNTRYHAPVVPSLNVFYAPTSHTTLRASYARGFRAPDLKELYLEFHYNSTINLWGNTNLRAENSDHLNLSADFSKEFNHHTIQFSPRLYTTRINDLIDLVQTSSIDWTYTNVDYLITRGCVVQLKYQYKNLEINTGYMRYGNFNSRFNAMTSSNRFFYSGDLNANVLYTVDSLRLNFSLAYKYTGKLQNYYIDDNQTLQPSKIGDYQLFDISSTKYLKNKKSSLTIGVKNLLNIRQVAMAGNVFGVSNPSDASVMNVLWGRSFFTSFNYTF